MKKVTNPGRRVGVDNPDPCPMLSGLKNVYNFHPETILDIGAHYGSFTKECNIIWPDAEVTMIEATREFAPELKALNNLDKYIPTGYPREKVGSKNEYVIALLGDSEKKVTFYKVRKDKISKCSNNTGHSIYKENSEQYTGEEYESEERDMQRLDSIFVTEETTFDLIKMDTQGSELDIINGGVDLIKKAKILIMEISFEECNIGAPRSTEVINFLEDLNFSPMDNDVANNKDGGWFWKPAGGKGQQDVVFVNKQL